MRAEADNNSAYSTVTKSLAFGTGGVDNAEDAEIILHRFAARSRMIRCQVLGRAQNAARWERGLATIWRRVFLKT